MAFESRVGVGAAARAFLHKLASAGGELTAQAFLLDAHSHQRRTVPRQCYIPRCSTSAAKCGAERTDWTRCRRLHLASRRCRQRLFGERAAAAAQRIDVCDLFHCSLRAGGGRTASRRFRDARVTVGWSAA